jgi:hypothetical protein
MTAGLRVCCCFYRRDRRKAQRRAGTIFELRKTRKDAKELLFVVLSWRRVVVCWAALATASRRSQTYGNSPGAMATAPRARRGRAPDFNSQVAERWCARGEGRAGFSSRAHSAACSWFPCRKLCRQLRPASFRSSTSTITTRQRGLVTLSPFVLLRGSSGLRKESED